MDEVENSNHPCDQTGQTYQSYASAKQDGPSLNDSIYVDDIAYGVEDEEQAVSRVKVTIQVRWLQSNCNVSADED